MVIVIFEFEPNPTYQDRYFELASALRQEVEKIKGFVSVERFESIAHSGRFVSISTWEDMDAVARWHQHTEHSAAQGEAKDQGMFRNYRIRVAQVVRDYGARLQ
ncbi:MAG: antibiotic biosynthesis monooxygenase [Acidiferrobacteraceae bacterium]|jgi:heme-degrading monooxygenase HmoA|nr:antibiotic biosynthesis monooxygenase [Acidiferrobacteraceae bacterium]MCP4827963.1 antibiotic biosynthesis monooxygenase [Pseudomonadota bacterium]HJP06728.1 antibiotic biosynthesis monooxygenase family protein [Arenicellales bacterium]|tara:strand:+ start:19391 stop:19702 length:312 start_codon:yes stop_codon:yes gene_type:complete